MLRTSYTAIKKNTSYQRQSAKSKNEEKTILVNANVNEISLHSTFYSNDTLEIRKDSRKKSFL